MRALYTLVLYLLAPFAFAHLQWRSLRQTSRRDRFRERLGLVPSTSGVPVIWIHGASLGELRSAQPLIKRLMAEYPQHTLTVTSFSASGREWAAANFDGRVQVSQAPLDLPGAVARFLTRTRPLAAIFLETEIWPNLYAACRARNIPVCLASARLTPRSARRYARFKGLTRAALAGVRVVSAQTVEDMGRFAELGAPAEALRVGGSFKLDIEVPESVRARGQELKTKLFGSGPVWLAASVREGEESAVADAFARVRAAVPDCRLVMAPRHPENARAAAAALGARGIANRRRSTGDVRIPPSDALVLDTLGEMFDFCAAADIAFVGGSLVPVGGHNLLEPAALGLPVLAGPHLDNVRETADALIRVGAMTVVEDGLQLADAVLNLLADPEARARARRAGLNVVMQNRGAVAAFLNAIEPCLARHPEPDRAD